MTSRPVIVALSFALVAATSLGGPPPAVQIIVNAKNPVQTLKRAEVAALVLKKTTTWPAGGKVHPVDQAEDSAVRKAFSQEVLKKSIAGVKSYWQQQIFSGRDVPPPERSSDEEVMAFVKSKDGAIGYVSGTTELAGVHAITLSD